VSSPLWLTSFISSGINKALVLNTFLPLLLGFALLLVMEAGELTQSNARSFQTLDSPSIVHCASTLVKLLRGDVIPHHNDQFDQNFSRRRGFRYRFRLFLG